MCMYASIDRFSLIPSGPPGISDFPSLAAILSFTYSDICNYLLWIRDYIRYIFYSTPLDPSIFMVVLTTSLKLNVLVLPVRLFCLLSHSTNPTHFWDIRVFQSFRNYHTDAIYKIVRLVNDNFGKLKFLSAFQSFCNQTFKPTTIRHTLKLIGLVFFNPNVVFDKIRKKQAWRV